MIRRLLIFVVVAAIGLFCLAVLSPVHSKNIERFFTQNLKEAITARLPFPGQREHALRVVDPTTISKALSEQTSRIAELFQWQQEEGVVLSIEDIIDETNKQRIAHGFAPLRTNALIIDSAEIKTNDMIVKQYFEHESPDGLGVSDLGRKVGYDYVIMGENLALGNFSDAADLLKAWMDSPGHRANILNTTYQEIGAYAMKGTYEGREVWFAVQHFGTSRNACPIIDSSLKKEITAMNVQLGIQENQIEVLKRELEDMNSTDPTYQEKVEIFNGMINGYNQLLVISKQKIAAYNAQVAKFNTCLAQYQD